MEFLLFIQFALTGAIRSGTSVLYATLGETVTERSGVINLGTEGCMIMGACIGFKVAADTGNIGLAIIAAALSGGLLSLIHGYLVINRGANQLASGLTPGFFGLGLDSADRPAVCQPEHRRAQPRADPAAGRYPVPRADPVPARPADLRELFPGAADLALPLPHALGSIAARGRRRRRGLLDRAQPQGHPVRRGLLRRHDVGPGGAQLCWR